MRNCAYNLVLALLSLLVFGLFWMSSRILNDIFVLLLGAPFSIVTFFLLYLLVLENKKSFRISLPRMLQYIPFFLALIAMIAALLIPSYEGSVFEWTKIPLVNWLRYSSTLLLTSFLPGYLLLGIMNRRRSLTRSMAIVVSYLLSIFVTFTIGFTILLVKGTVFSPLVIITIILVNLSLLAMRILLEFLNRKRTVENLILNVRWCESAVIVSIVALVMVSATLVAISNLPLTPWDMWGLHGGAMQYAKGFPVYGGVIAPEYPYLFYIYSAVVSSISGLPSAISQQGLYVFSFMPILAFYSLSKEWFGSMEDRKIPIFATFLSTLIGFGSIYALYLGSKSYGYDVNAILGLATSNTYDLYMRILLLPDYVAPLWSISLPSLLVLLGLLKTKSEHLLSYVLIAILVAVGFLGHIVEITIFVIIALIYYTLFRRNSSGRNLGMSIFVGLLLVAAFDMTAPAQQYLIIARYGARTISLPYAVSLTVAMAVVVIDCAKNKQLVHSNLRLPSFAKVKKIWSYCKFVLIYAFAFSFVVWFILLTTNDLTKYVSFSFTPFFFLPIRMGIVGLLAITFVVVYFHEIASDKRLVFFSVMMALGFALEQASNYVIPLYPSYRFGTFTFIGACMISGWGSLHLLKKASVYGSQLKKRHIFSRNFMKLLISCLLIIAAIPGMLGTSMFYVYAAYTSNRYYASRGELTQDELNAIQFISQHLLNNESILTFTDESANRLESFAGVRQVQDAYRWSELLLSTSNPYIITYVLGSSNIKYVYVAQRDATMLENSELAFFLKYFPEVLKNDYVTVYEVPPLTAPFLAASFGVLNFSPFPPTLENTTWTDTSFAEGWSQYRTYGNVQDCRSEVINGAMNISVASNQSGNTWASFARSRLSLNTTIYSSLYFNYRVANSHSWFTLELWNSTDQVFFYVGRLSETDFTKESFDLPENQTITRIEIIVETVTSAPANTTASASIDYIQFSAPLLAWRDDTFLSGWAFYGQYGNVSDWDASSDGDIVKLGITSNQSGNVWGSYSLPLSVRTKNSVLSFRYKVDNDYTWFTVILQNASDRFFFYRGHLTDKTFTTLSYPLPEGQIITRVELIIETTVNAPRQTTAIAQIDKVEISQQPFSESDVLPSLFISLLHSNYSSLYIDDKSIANMGEYLRSFSRILLASDPSVPVPGLLDWVSAGNTLIVFNTEGNGFIANLLGIDNTSPLLSINNFDSGKVLYINSLPKVATGKWADILQPGFIDEVSNLLSLNGFVQTIRVLPIYNSIYGDVYFTGNLRVDTNALMLRGAIDLTNSSVPFSESTEMKIYGKIDLTIENATFLISPSESYLLIKPEDYFVRGDVLLNSQENASIVSESNAVYTLDVPSTFEFNATHLSIYAKLPSIAASGTITFDQLDVESSLYIPLAGIVQQPAEIIGVVRFETMFISNPITMFSMFRADGDVINLAETSTPKPTIPWLEILASPYNVTFNVIFFLGVLVYLAKKRQLRTSINRNN